MCVWLLVGVVGCSVPAFTSRRMDARADMGDLGNDAPGDALDASVDASDAISAADVVDAVTTDLAPDADVADVASADADALDVDAPEDTLDVNVPDAPPDVVPGDVSDDVPPRSDATPLLTGGFVSSSVPSTPTGLLSGGFTWLGDLRSERLNGWLR
jgi:hypothetical protein